MSGCALAGLGRVLRIWWRVGAAPRPPQTTALQEVGDLIRATTQAERETGVQGVGLRQVPVDVPPTATKRSSRGKVVVLWGARK